MRGLLLPGLLVLAVCRMPAQTTVVLNPAKDATLYEDAAGALANGSGAGLFAGRSFQPARKRALLGFDVAAAVPPGATVLSAQLALTCTLTVVGPSRVGLYAVLQDWGEGASVAPGQGGGGTAALPGDATWLHTFAPGGLWSDPGGDHRSWPSAVTVVDQPGVYAFGSDSDVIADVQGWVDAPATNFGWMLIGEESTFSAKRFGSREALVASQMPTLTITWTTAPAASAVPVGPGCFVPGQRFPFRLRATEPPASGAAGFALRLSDGPAGAPLDLFLAGGTAAAPILLGACPIHLDPVSALALIAQGSSPIGGLVLDGGGALVLPVPLPASGLSGATVSLQAIAPGPGLLLASNALTLHFL